MLFPEGLAAVASFCTGEARKGGGGKGLGEEERKGERNGVGTEER